MPTRAALIAAAVAALPIAAIWWFGTLLLTSDNDSACIGSVSAKLAFGASHIGIALAVAALISAWRRALRVGWTLLAIYGTLLGISTLIFFTCD